jgi:serine/threonine protein kinase
MPMTPERWERIKRLFEGALEHDAATRIHFLTDACGGDESLIADVMQLLVRHDSARDFLEHPLGSVHRLPVTSGRDPSVFSADDGLLDAPAATDNAADDLERPSLGIGSRIGPYEVLAQLKGGGMGDVYRARDTRLNRPVAIKILPQHLRRHADLRARFEREARAIAALNDPHICAVHDVGQHAGVDFLVMEYLEGETLEERITRTKARHLPPFSIKEAIRYAIQIASALDRAHREGIVHRDLKPSNVMLTPTGAKLFDFGVVKIVGHRLHQAAAITEPEAPRPLTEDGVIVGTLHYMAPEQLECRRVDSRSDVFSFGAVLFEMLTGRNAFGGTSPPAVMAAILTGQPPPLRSLVPTAPLALERILQKCLEKDPEARWQSIRDVRDELQWIAETGLEAPSTQQPSPPLVGRKRLAGAVAVLVSGTIAVVGTSYLTSRGFFGQSPVSFTIAAPDAGPLSSPALSPDGKALVFASGVGGTSTLLWMRTLSSPDASPLPGSEGASTPFWSPDSRFIGYWQDGQIKRTPVTGGPAVPIADVDVAAGASWSRNGDMLFSKNGALFLSGRSGGREQQLTHPERTRHEVHRWPYFLPDGQHFLYTSLSDEAGTTGIYVGSLSSERAERVLPGSSNGVYAQPGVLLFINGGVLKAQRFDQKTRRVLGDSSDVASNVNLITDKSLGEFSASDSGMLAYNQIVTALNQLVWFDRGGREIERLAPPDSYWDPTSSPDDTTIAYTRAEPASPFQRDIWVFDTARRTTSRLTFDPANDWYPVWSADGRSLLFASQRRGPNDFYQKLANGAEPEREVLKSETIQWPNDWSSDGRFLIYQKMALQAKYDLWVLPFDGQRKPFPFLQTPFDEQQAQFSPDAKWVAYTSDETGMPEVYVQSFPAGADKSKVSTSGGCQPRWRRNGRELFYLSADRRLMSVDVSLSPKLAIGTPVALFSTAVPPGGVGTGAAPDYSVSADGQRFLVRSPSDRRWPTTMTVVLNWMGRISQ